MTVERYLDVHARSELSRSMDLFNSYNFLTLGRAFERFLSFEAGATRASIWLHSVRLSEALKALSGAGGVKLAVCEKPIGNLQRLLDESGFTEFPGNQGHEVARLKDIVDIQYAIGDLETVLAAELASIGTYFATPKQAYNVLTLIYEGESLIPEELVPMLPPDAVTDLRQCGKCLAFEIPTASGFHVARATESVLLAYMDALVGSRPKQRNWGQYIDHLTNAKVDSKVTSFVALIKDTYRNPVIHPEVTLTTTEAQVLVNACVSVMTLMLTAIRAKRMGDAQGAEPDTVE